MMTTRFAARVSERWLLLRPPGRENVGPGRGPHATAAQHTVEHLLDGGNAVRHPADPGPQRQRHDSSAAGGGLAAEQLEMIHHLLDELRRLVLVEMKELQVAD